MFENFAIADFKPQQGGAICTLIIWPLEVAEFRLFERGGKRVVKPPLTTGFTANGKRYFYPLIEIPGPENWRMFQRWCLTEIDKLKKRKKTTSQHQKNKQS